MFIPWFFDISVRNFKFIREFLIPISISNISIIFEIYYCFKRYMNDNIMKEKLYKEYLYFLNQIGEKNVKELKKLDRFIKLINLHIKLSSNNSYHMRNCQMV